MKKLAVYCFFLLCAFSAIAQYTRQDTLRGSNGRGRDWWDVLKYDLWIHFNIATKTLQGRNTMLFKVISIPIDSMQIDLQDSMQLDEVTWSGKSIPFKREGNVYWVKHALNAQVINSTQELKLMFHGKPREAVNPPWDGGLIWNKDSMGKPWIAVACQHLGASSWWPCKDYQGDEPDSGMRVEYDVPLKDAYAIGNGNMTFELPYVSVTVNPRTHRKVGKRAYGNSTAWAVNNPINTYNTSFYVGDYAHWHDTLRGEKGVLDLDFYPLRYNESKARKHWAVTKDMLRCFEHWFGPYPFYEDGYKLVEAPYLGMEHQSAIAYGNGYQMGYRGRDVFSRTGVGLSFDYIIIHESAHEWFGNSITARDPAENWLHESFATYGEALFAEWILGKDSAFRYTRGQWGMIRHDGRDVLGTYGVNYRANSDVYCKGSAVLHMIRMMLHNDEQFRQLLRGLNKEFYHKIVSSKEVEAYISAFCGMNLAPFFNQYLRHSGFPVVHAKQSGESIKLDLLGYDESVKLPVYDQNGKFVCELSRKPARIPVKDLPALRNYLIMYISEPGTIALPPN